MRDSGGKVVDLGSGDGRDTNFFKKWDIDVTPVDIATTGVSVKDYMKDNSSPKYVYTRFFWHAISREEQLAILEWASDYVLIEARTTDDEGRTKIYDDHNRNYVDVNKLVSDLKYHGFEIRYLAEGTNFSKMEDEDPHLVRVVAHKTKK